jgi:uncharacterized membrane protein
MVVSCAVCGRTVPSAEALPADFVRPSITAAIRHDHPQWSSESFICWRDLSRYRARHVQELLEDERGDLTALEQEVVRSLGEQELLSANVNETFDRRLTFGERVADRVASFGGSWGFIISFGVVLMGWIVLNAAVLRKGAFDPYPFILLNLMLSCLAAIQAPVIMMSQNRQEAKDRMRTENDYRVNLKAELEVRLLSTRFDHLLSRQWQHLMEIQEIQVDLMEEIATHRRQVEGGTGGEAPG